MISRRRLRLSVLALALTVVVTTGRPSQAQPSPPVVVFRADSERARPTLQICREAWQDHGAALAASILAEPAAADTVVCLVVGSEGFRQLGRGQLPDWGVGFAVPSGRTIVLDHERLPQVRRSPAEVFLHEMAHALLFQAARGVWLPTWLHEGVAMRASGQWRWTDTVAVVLGGHVPSLDAIRGPFPQNPAAAETAYRASLLAVNFLVHEHGTDAPVRIVREAATHGDFVDGFDAATGEDYDVFQARFRAAMRLRYGWVFLLVRWPTLFVLMALLFVAGAGRRMVRNRRRLREMERDESADSGG